MRLGIILLLLVSINVSAQHSVFEIGKSTYYEIRFSNDSINHIDTIQLITTGNPWKTAPGKQGELIINYLSADSSIFSNIPTIGWVEADTTGFVENEFTTWFHPPRHNQYKILETAPFPRVEFPLFEGKTFSRMLVIGEGWGTLTGSQLKWNYFVKNSFYEEDDQCWQVTAEATPVDDPSIQNILNFTFCENKGFVSLNYKFSNGTIISINQLAI